MNTTKDLEWLIRFLNVHRTNKNVLCTQDFIKSYFGNQSLPIHKDGFDFIPVAGVDGNRFYCKTNLNLNFVTIEYCQELEKLLLQQEMMNPVVIFHENKLTLLRPLETGPVYEVYENNNGVFEPIGK